MKKSILSRLRTMLVLSLALVLVLSLTGCFQKEDPKPTEDEKEPTTQVDPTDAPTDAPTEEPTDAPTEAPTAPAQKSVMGTVSANNLNVRSNVSTDSTVLSQLPVDLRIEVLEQKTVGDTTWGRIGEMVLPNGTKVTGGWINMSYVKLDGAEPETPTQAPTTPTTGSNDSTVSGTGKKGTVTADTLNIRKSTTTTSERMGTYMKGDVVEILEQKTVDGTTWGRTAKGWVSMKYIRLEGQTTTITPEDDKEDDKTTSSEVVTDGKTKILGYGVVDIGSLNVRSGPGTKYDKVDTVSNGSRYAYYQKSGNWVRIKSGWISVSYFYLEGTTGSNGGNGIILENVNIRKGPGTSFDKVDSLEKDEAVKILAQVNGWGYTGKGWVSMKYVKLASSDTTYTTGTGTVTADELNIRKTADGETTGKVYKKGAKVEVTKIDGEWGQTKDGWIHMAYVKMDTPAPTYKTGKGTISANELNIRESPKGKLTGKAYTKGAKVEITKIDGEWGQTKDGWIHMAYVEMDPVVTYKTGTGSVSANELNVRKGPGINYETTGKVYKKGDKVTVTEISGNWGKTKDGWIHMQHVKMDTTTENEDNIGKNTTFKEGTATVEVNSTLTIRKSASTSADKLGTLKNGAKVNVLKVSGEWGQIEYEKGEYGWINLRYVKYS